MSKKKKQHTVPEAYLRGFISSEIPSEHQENPRFDPGVWVTRPDLRGGWEHRHPSNVLTKSYFYNLPDDSPDAPVIEEFLSRVELSFPRIRSGLESGRLPQGEDLAALLMFASTLSVRTEAQIDHWERQFVGLREMYRQVGSFDSEELTGDYIADTDPSVLARRLILEPALGRLLLAQGIWVLRNKTDELFVTSDNPVIHQQWHADDLQQAVPGLVEPDVLRSQRHPVTLLPLGPRHMLVSSPFLRSSRAGCDVHDLTEPAAALWLNILTLAHADELVVSSRTRVSQGDDQLLGTGMEQLDAARRRGVFISVYTRKDRYWLPVADLDRSGGRVSFVPLDLAEFRRLVDDGDLDHLEVYRGTDLIGGMRQICFHAVDLTGAGPSVIRHVGALDTIFSAHRE